MKPAGEPAQGIEAEIFFCPGGAKKIEADSPVPGAKHRGCAPIPNRNSETHESFFWNFECKTQR
jgi:hypothetical protein